MAKHLVRVDFTDLYIGVPVFLTLILMPLTYSISSGIAYGFASYVILCLLTKNTNKVHPVMWFIGILSFGEILVSQW